MNRRHRSSIVLVAAGVMLAAVGAQVGELRVMTSGAFTAPYLELGPMFEKLRQIKLVTAATSMGTGADFIPSRIQRGEPVDVVIVADAALDDMIRDGLIMTGSKVPLARSAIGMAVREGTPLPDISSVDAFKRTLLQAKSVAYSASVSGDYLSQELFARLGIAEQMKAKSRRIERERVGAVVARGEAEIGFQQISELLPIGGITLVGPLPAEIQRVTVFSAAVAASSRNLESARALIGFLASRDAAPVITRAGLEPIAQR